MCRIFFSNSSKKCSWPPWLMGFRWSPGLPTYLGMKAGLVIIKYTWEIL